MFRRSREWSLLATLCTGLLAASCASTEVTQSEGDEDLGEAVSALAPGCVTIVRGGAGNAYDVHLAPGNGTWASGNYSSTWTGGGASNNHSAFKFDLSPVPANANVISATFDVHVQWNDEVSTVNAHEITTPWSEATATWPNIGGTASYSAPVLGSFSPAWGANGHRTVDLTALTRAWLDGSKANNGIMLAQPSGGSRMYLTSETGQADKRPSLTVCWDGELPSCDFSGDWVEHLVTLQASETTVDGVWNGEDPRVPFSGTLSPDGCSVLMDFPDDAVYEGTLVDTCFIQWSYPEEPGTVDPGNVWTKDDCVP